MQYRPKETQVGTRRNTPSRLRLGEESLESCGVRMIVMAVDVTRSA